MRRAENPVGQGSSECHPSSSSHFECTNDSPAYFDAHCEGDTLVREDMNPCPAELSAAMECYSEN